MNGRLYLIPVLLSDDAPAEMIPSTVKEIIATLRFFIVEEEKTARRFLKKIIPSFPLEEATFYVFNEHTPVREVANLLLPLNTQNAGLMSEAGMPCVADPGREIVFEAHRRGIQVIPLPGMSSIFMALMASGLNGQHFTFHGYLPARREDRIKKIRDIITHRDFSGATHIVMETPYRNEAFFQDLIKVLPPQALLCVASGITSYNEYIYTAPVEEWKRKNFTLKKQPALFLFCLK